MGREFVFSLQMNIKVSYKLISTLWASTVPTRWYYHYCWVWSSILKVVKVINLHCLYNISKKEVKKGAYFLHADKLQSLLFLIQVARYVQINQNRKLVIFLQRLLQLLLCFIVMQNIQIPCGGPFMFIVTCFLAQPD